MTSADLDASAPDATVVDASRLRQFTQLVFEKAGLRSADAQLLADHLNWCDRRGISWLGVNKIPQYLERLRTGCTSADAQLSIVSDLPGFVLIDGNDTFGQVVGYHAMKAAIDKARTTGVAIAVVRNTTSAGALGYFAALAAEEGMIGLAINNSTPLIPAVGSAVKVVGNQAFAVSSPAASHSPLVLDMATSAITLARIHDYDNRGEPLPQGLALDADGAPTTDPAAALRGTLLPMAGHRGFGLALMWEVLTGVLAGGPRFSRNVTGPDEFDRPQGVSMFLLAVDPALIMPHDTFTERVDQLIDQVKEPGSTGTESVRVPGEHSAQICAERDRHGIPVPATLFARLREIGADLGVGL